MKVILLLLAAVLTASGQLWPQDVIIEGDTSTHDSRGVRPVQISSPEPRWPRSSALPEGTQDVVVAALVGHDGEVERAEVLRTSRVPAFDSAAVAAALKARFTPATLRSNTVRFYMALWYTPKVWTGSIAGFVSHDQTHEPLVGVSVSIEALADTVQTDSQGRYAFANVPPDRYRVLAASEVYNRADVQNVVVDSGVTELNLTVGERGIGIVDFPHFRPDPIDIPRPIWPLPDSSMSMRWFRLIVRAFVNDEGRVTKAEVIESSSGSRRFDAAAVLAALLSTWTPKRALFSSRDSVVTIPYAAEMPCPSAMPTATAPERAYTAALPHNEHYPAAYLHKATREEAQGAEALKMAILSHGHEDDEGWRLRNSSVDPDDWLRLGAHPFLDRTFPGVELYLSTPFAPCGGLPGHIVTPSLTSAHFVCYSRNQ